jgi:hypothetical protein
MVEKSPALKSFEQTLGQMGFTEDSIRDSLKRIGKLAGMSKLNTAHIL